MASGMNTAPELEIDEVLKRLEKGSTEETPEGYSLVVVETADQLSDRADALALHTTPEWRGLIQMDSFDIGYSQFSVDCKAKLVEINEMDPVSAFAAIDKLIEDYFHDAISEAVHTHIGQDSHRAFTDKVIDAMKTDRPFGSLEGEHDPAYSTWVRIYMKMIACRDQALKDYVNESPHSDELNEPTKLEYRHFPDISQAINKFFYVWNRDQARYLSTDQRRKMGFLDELATIRRGEEGWEEVKWKDAFPEEVEAVAAAYGSLADDLRDEMESMRTNGQLSEEDEELFMAKYQYYNSLAAAYRSCELEDFYIADGHYVNQNAGREDATIHIHTIEYGYWTDNIQRIPGASLRLIDRKNGADVIEHALRTRTDMTQQLAKLVDDEGFSGSVPPTVEFVNNSFFYTNQFISSGDEMVFPPAGQMLPNEPEPRALGGGLGVTIDMSSMKKRIPSQRRAFEVVFGTELADEHCTIETLEKGLEHYAATRLANHEFGHAVGTSGDLLERLEKNVFIKNVEEWKATVGGMILGEWMPYLDGGGEGKVDMEDLRESVIAHLTTPGRYCEKRKVDFAVNYLKKSCMIARVAEECGIVFEQEDGTWGINLGEDQITAFYERLTEQYIALLHIYDRGNMDDLNAWMDENLQPCKFMAFVFAKTDEANPNLKDAPTLEEVCSY